MSSLTQLYTVTRNLRLSRIRKLKKTYFDDLTIHFNDCQTFPAEEKKKETKFPESSSLLPCCSCQAILWQKCATIVHNVYVGHDITS